MLKCDHCLDIPEYEALSGRRHLEHDLHDDWYYIIMWGWAPSLVTT